LLSFFSFPHLVGSQVVDLGLPLAWFGPACLLLALRGSSPCRAAKLAFLGAWVAHALILHWIYVVTVHYGGAPPVVGALAAVLLGAVIGAHFALFGAGWGWLSRIGFANPLSAALLWTAVEYLRSFLLLGGFPWATLGYTQIHNTALCAVAPWTGVYGISFAVVLGGAASAELCSAWRTRTSPSRIVWIVLMSILLLEGFGALDLARDGNRDVEVARPVLRIAAAQGNIAQDVKWDESWAERTLQIYEELSRRAVGEGARLVLWPETAVPGSISMDSALRLRLEDLAKEMSAVFVVGGVGVDAKPSNEWRYFDSAYVFDVRGQLRERYDKAHLVPFGEYVPFQRLIGRFAKAIAAGISLEGITPGRGPRALRLLDLWSYASGLPAQLTVGVPICYELVFPDLVRRMVRDGSSVLLGITNDAWYGRTGAPYQLLAMSAMRSAENRVWSVRAANTGVSAVIDDRGRVVDKTPIFESGLLVWDVPLRSEGDRGTWYSRHGDRFAQGCVVALLVLAALGRFLRAPRRGGIERG